MIDCALKLQVFHFSFHKTQQLWILSFFLCFFFRWFRIVYYLIESACSCCHQNKKGLTNNHIATWKEKKNRKKWTLFHRCCIAKIVQVHLLCVLEMDESIFMKFDRSTPLLSILTQPWYETIWRRRPQQQLMLLLLTPLLRLFDNGIVEFTFTKEKESLPWQKQWIGKKRKISKHFKS